MSFSAFNVGRQMMIQTGNVSPKQNFGSRPIAGGAFAPSTLEAAFVLRSNLDYQFETAFLDKHRATMQNRLNEMSQRLEEAYKDLLNVAMSQQVGENADRNLRADVRLDGTDGSNGAQIIRGIMGETGFEDLGVNPDTQTQLNYASPGLGNVGSNVWRSPNKGGDGLSPTGPFGDDGVGGYSKTMDGGVTSVQFRALMDRTTAAGNIAGEMDITLRVEDDPPEPTSLDGSLGLLNQITTALTGGPPAPTYFNQKVEQYSAGYSTGGFWSAVNYLYDFAPREIKYTYAVGYTVNSDEAGDDEYLINGELVNRRDIPNDTNADLIIDDEQAYLKKDNRVKWVSNNPLEGYQHERSGSSANYPIVTNRQKAWLDESSSNIPWDTTPTSAEGAVAIVDHLIFQSGTYTYNGTFVNETGGFGAGIAGTQIVGGKVIQTSGTSNGSMVRLLDSNIQLGSKFVHTVDMTVAANDDTLAGGDEFKINDRGAIKSSLFFNHYEVETRTVEFNNKNNVDLPELTNAPTATLADDAVGSIYVKGGISRSTSIDASKSYENVKINPLLPDTDDPSTDPNKEISRSAGNTTSSFNGEFLHSLHKIQSVNGQDVVGNENKQASPVLGNFELGRYEGVERSYQMNRNVVAYRPPTEMEINAADTVPTDWHQAEMLTGATQDPALPDNGAIWFPHVDDTLYSAKDSAGYGRESAPRQLVQARNTFSLERDEILTLQPANLWNTDATGTVRPTYYKKDMYIDVELTGIHYDTAPAPPDPSTPQVPKIFINGREYTGVPISVSADLGVPGSHVKDVVYRINLNSGDPAQTSFAQEGLNTITVQASDGQFINIPGQDSREGIKVTATDFADYPSSSLNTPADNASVLKTLNSKVITGYATVDGVAPDVKYADTLNRPDTIKSLSRWQTRLVPVTSEIDTNSKLLRLSSTQASTGTSNKAVNTFIELVISMMNDRKYKDVFKLGLLSNLNKLAINGQAQLPSGSSLQGAISMYYDAQQQTIVLIQDKLVAQSRAAT
jgi:hypothetical protein